RLAQLLSLPALPGIHEQQGPAMPNSRRLHLGHESLRETLSPRTAVDEQLHRLRPMIAVSAHLQSKLYRPLHDFAFERRQQNTRSVAHGGDHSAPILARLRFSQGRHEANRRTAIDSVDQKLAELPDGFRRLFRRKRDDHNLTSA